MNNGYTKLKDYHFKDAVNRILGIRIFKEETTVCPATENLGFLIVIKGPDHNKPHAHVMKTDHKSEIGQFILTENPPVRATDIQVSMGRLSRDIRDKIVEWSHTTKPEFNMTNWQRLIYDWNAENPDKPM
jgi:hypothetical protein